MDVFALWPVVFYKNVLVLSNMTYFGKAYLSFFLLLYLSQYAFIRGASYTRVVTVLIFTEKFSPLPGFEPGTSLVPSRYATN